MRRGTLPAVGALALLLSVTGAPAWAGSAVALDDAALDGVFGGQPTAETEERGSPPAMAIVQTTQTITGPVQQGASSIISVFAVNSAVNAQLNLIVGDVGHAAQVNAGTVGQSTQLTVR